MIHYLYKITVLNGKHSTEEYKEKMKSRNKGKGRSTGIFITNKEK